MKRTAAPITLGPALLGASVLVGSGAAVWYWTRPAPPAASNTVATNAATAPSALPAPVGPWVGTERCGTCHADAWKAFRGSHHDAALTLPTPDTVRGAFDGRTFVEGAVKSEFLRRGDDFVIRTDGPDGKISDHVVRYVAGIAPLQQYVFELANGHLQPSSLAWDTRSKSEGGERWYHLYAGQNVTSDDPLHWTKAAQNWNHVCADCHSTGVRRNFDVATSTFRTTWAERTVGCEGCHGPGAAHVAWAQRGSPETTRGKGLTVSLVASTPWSPSSTGSPTPRKRDDAQVETCAPCHSRRETMHEGTVPGDAFLDGYEPELLREDRYEADGQVQGEVYEWGSFTQSRMFHAGVRCSDCHEPHTATLRAPGNALCVRCHDGAKLDGPGHHHHPAAAAATPACVDCHMPRHVFMGVDERRDHSLRIPRPDLSVALGVPNACNACHTKNDARWAATKVAEWYPKGAARPHFAKALAAGRTGAPGATAALAALGADTAAPAIARATALEILGRSPSADGLKALRDATIDAESLVVYGAILGLDAYPVEARYRLLAPLLSARHRLVRVTAAKSLADVPLAELPPGEAERLEKAFAEVDESFRATASRPESHVERGAFEVRRRHRGEAEAEYRTALRLEPNLTEAYINLADLHRLAGDEGASEADLRAALATNPKSADAHHALGLLAIRRGDQKLALAELSLASRLAPANARFAYVNAVALENAGDRKGALRILASALVLHPYDPALLQAAGDYREKEGDHAGAEALRNRLAEVTTPTR